MEVLYNYFIRGVIQENIFDDGGELCSQEIPAAFAWTVAVACSVLCYYTFVRLFRSTKIQIPAYAEPNLLERMFAYLSLATYVVQFYYKLKTGKGLFMLNPCHTNVLMMSYLALKPTTRLTKIVYVCWEAWLFGPLLSLVFPHLGGLQLPFEVFIYYLEHVLILPIGVLLLQRRYGLSLPTIKNQLLGFATASLYQYVLLMPVSRFSKVNLNFTLCHSHADPAFGVFGYGYFLMGFFYLNFASYVIRLVFYPVRWLFGRLLPDKNKAE